MFCSRCGKELPAGAFNCDCSQSTTSQSQGVIPDIPNRLVPAILVTLFCCLPFGIVAIVYAAQVNSKLQAGDVSGAQIASNNAKTWCWVAFGLGLVSTIGCLIIQVLAVAAAGTANSGFGY